MNGHARGNPGPRWRVAVVVWLLMVVGGVTPASGNLAMVGPFNINCGPGVRMHGWAVSQGPGNPARMELVAILKSGELLFRGVSGPFSVVSSALADFCLLAVSLSLSRPLDAREAGTVPGLRGGVGPVDLAAADLNGDGIPDAAVANQDSNDVSIFLVKADGTAQAAVNFPTGTSPVRIAAGDWNGDGKIDLVTVNAGSGGGGNLSLLLSNGDGTFQAPIPVAAGVQPLDVDRRGFQPRRQARPGRRPTPRARRWSCGSATGTARSSRRSSSRCRRRRSPSWRQISTGMASST